MSDRSALAVREEVEAREQETEVGSQEETDQTLTPVLSQGERQNGEQEVAENAEERGQTTVDRGQAESGQGDAIGSLTPPARQGLAERIRQSEALPAGLRARLAELVLADDGAAGEQAIRAVEAALPLALRSSIGEVARPAHPGGETFFRGDADAVSEQAAEALARGQLARSGMLRGQRARVAD